VSDHSAIEWTDATWNPVSGCTKVSPGCDHCYAETFAERFRGVSGHPYEQGFDLRLWPERLALPLRWRRPRRVFVNSMSDLFHKDVPSAFIAQVWATMAATPQHIYQVLSKRPGRMASILAQVCPEPLGNVWLGTSIELDRLTWRADVLRGVPASVRFLSLEPLLGPLPNLELDGIGWVIVGGESGPHHRPIHSEWVCDLRDRCVDQGVAFFFKQWGGRTPKAGGRLLDGRTWNQLPTRAPVGTGTASGSAHEPAGSAYSAAALAGRSGSSLRRRGA
jgi:protein gp37